AGVGEPEARDEVGAVPVERKQLQVVGVPLVVGVLPGGDRLGVLLPERGGRCGVADVLVGGGLLLRGLRLGLRHLDVVGDLDPPVAGARLLVVVPALLGDRLGGALALGLVDVVRAESLLQVVADRLGALLGELLVVVVGALAVGVRS